MKLIRKYLFVILALVVVSCRKPVDSPVIITLDESPYVLDYGAFPAPELPTDNPMTIQGVKLGKMLFFEKMMSRDGTLSCAGCHRQSDGFSDSLRFSIGVEMLPGKRQAMPIFNMAWHNNEFFWDGRAHLLRDQSLLPIQDGLEMNETLENVIAKLSATQKYKDQFSRAFGSEEITSLKMSLAMEQFMLSIVSNDSKYDRYLAGTVELTESEERGRILFETEYNEFFPDQSGADCVHCHGGINFLNNQYMNNGLDSDVDMVDIGREEVTGNSEDKGKFKVPTLRNIAVTAPYMHDGRFQTLEEVIQHYNSELQASSTIDPALESTMNTGLLLTEQDISDLVDFLGTLTDDTFRNNEEYYTPF